MGTRFIIFCLLVLLAGCSAGKKASRKMQVSALALSTNDFVGGVMLRMENVATGSVVTVDLLTPPFVAQIPDGTWNLHVVAYEGSSSWAGASHCGGLSNLVLTEANLQIAFQVTPAQCASAPYLSMLASKPAHFEFGKWDNGKWGL